MTQEGKIKSILFRVKTHNTHINDAYEEIHKLLYEAYQEGALDAQNDAAKEIRKNYQPN